MWARLTAQSVSWAAGASMPKNAHGGNTALRELAATDARHRPRSQFSILQFVSPSAPPAQVDATEAHFMRTLLTRQFGMNLN